MRRVARGSVANLAGAAVTGLCTFALTVVIARGVSKQDAGVFFAVTSLFLIATTIGNLGTQTGLVYFLARCRTRGATGEIDSYVRTALWPMLVLAVVMAAGTFVLAPELARLISDGDAHRATVYLRCIAWFIPLAGIEIVLLAGTRGLGAIRPYALIEQIYRPVLQLALVVVVIVAFSASLLGLAWESLCARRSGRRRLVAARARPVLAAPRRARASSGGSGVLAVHPAPIADEHDPDAHAALRRRSGRRAGQSGGCRHLRRCHEIIVLGQLGINALTIAAQPRFAETLSTDDHRPANELYHVTTSWLMILTWPVYLLLLVFATPILTVFGRGYPAGATSIAIIAASMLIATGSGMVDTVLAMAGRHAVEPAQRRARPCGEPRARRRPDPATRDPRRGHRVGGRHSRAQPRCPRSGQDVAAVHGAREADRCRRAVDARLLRDRSAGGEDRVRKHRAGPADVGGDRHGGLHRRPDPASRAVATGESGGHPPRPGPRPLAGCRASS